MIGLRINAHEIAVDTAIATAFETYAKAMNHLLWYEGKEGTRFAPPEADVAKARAAATEARAALLAAEVEYGGWSRFFLVQASNGHIHSSMNCSTCFPTTQYAWLPELSGLTEADAVDEWGGILCSICFKSAPSDWTEGTNKKDAQRKADEAALKAIAKTPEGKAVIGKRELVRRHEYRMGEFERALTAEARNAEAAAKYGADPLPLSHWEIKAAERALAEMPATEKKLLKARAQLADAEAALERALEG